MSATPPAVAFVDDIKPKLEEYKKKIDGRHPQGLADPLIDSST